MGGGDPGRVAPKVKAKLPQQFKLAKKISLAVIIGQNELAEELIRIKVKGTGEKTGSDEKDGGQLIAQKILVDEVKKFLRNI